MLVEEGCDIARELYLGMVLDRAVGRLTMMASTEGGVEIEEVAAKTPEKILQGDDRSRRRPAGDTKRASSPSASASRRSRSTRPLPSCPASTRRSPSRDCSLAEINPAGAHRRKGDLLALDAKMGFDDNALYRHADIREMRDFAEEDPREVEAAKYDLSYIALDGNIGCMVNGAGLAMATMDIIKYYGGEPANFLDVGGGATTEKVTAAFKILLADPNVKAILVNIFGGIMKCDVIAAGIVAAAKEVEARGPARGAARGHERRSRQEDPRGVGLEHHPGRRTWPTPREKVGEGEPAEQADEHPRRQEHAGRHPGDHRRDGPVPHQGVQGLRHADGRRRDARQGRHELRRDSDLRHGRDRRYAQPEPTRPSSTFRRHSPRTRFSKRSTRACDAGRLHHRRDSGADMVRGQARHGRQEDASRSAPTARASSRRANARSASCPGYIHKKGSIGVVSRSGTLTYEAVQQLTQLGLGQSTCVGIGGDPSTALEFVDVLRLFQRRPRDAGDHHDRRDRRQRGGRGRGIRQAARQEARGRLHRAARPRPKESAWATPGAIISGGQGTAADKIKAFEAAGIRVAKSPAELGSTMRQALGH